MNVYLVLLVTLIISLPKTFNLSSGNLKALKKWKLIKICKKNWLLFWYWSVYQYYIKLISNATCLRKLCLTNIISISTPYSNFVLSPYFKQIIIGFYNLLSSFNFPCKSCDCIIFDFILLTCISDSGIYFASADHKSGTKW